MSEPFDFAIIGAGAAGLNLAMRMHSDPFFSDKKVLILDKSRKESNDKTWCFWEAGNGRWDHLVRHSWPVGRFYGLDREIRLNLDPYRYKMICALDFYTHCREQLEGAKNFTWQTQEVNGIKEQSDRAEIKTDSGTFSALHVFDSRVSSSFQQENDGHIRLWQHFKGWRIKTEEPAFDCGEFVMMDFRIKWKDSTSFIYILPVSKHEALVEFTLFTSNLLEDEEYDKMIKGYIDEILRPGKYEVTDTEKGIIPMTDFPFHRNHSRMITKIGTAGGWVRGSTGYSFRNSMKFTEQIVDNIKSGKSVLSGLSAPLHRRYDSIFLNVLHHRNHLGERIFTDLYSKNPIQNIFRFLDGESSRFEELQIIGSLPSLPFMDGLIRSI